MFILCLNAIQKEHEKKIYIYYQNIIRHYVYQTVRAAIRRSIIILSEDNQRVVSTTTERINFDVNV